MFLTDRKAGHKLAKQINNKHKSTYKEMPKQTGKLEESILLAYSENYDSHNDILILTESTLPRLEVTPLLSE